MDTSKMPMGLSHKKRKAPKRAELFFCRSSSDTCKKMDAPVAPKDVCSIFSSGL